MDRPGRPHSALVVGAGSIARRHLANLKQLGVSSLAACDPNPDPLAYVQEKFGLFHSRIYAVDWRARWTLYFQTGTRRRHSGKRCDGERLSAAHLQCAQPKGRDRSSIGVNFGDARFIQAEFKHAPLHRLSFPNPTRFPEGAEWTSIATFYHDWLISRSLKALNSSSSSSRRKRRRAPPDDSPTSTPPTAKNHICNRGGFRGGTFSAHMVCRYRPFDSHDGVCGPRHPMPPMQMAGIVTLRLH